jgi:hypothetical protein
MKTKTVSVLPKCDFCGKDAKYDVPTKHGPWGNLCGSCYKNHAAFNACTVGTQFEQRTPTKNNADQAIKTAKLLTSLEDMVFDSVMDLECPSCGENRSLEPDFSGTFTCEGCGQKLKFHNPLY